MCFGGHHLIRDVIRRLVPGEHRAGPVVLSLSEPGRIRVQLELIRLIQNCRI
jgi:hypothetical protein